jgi:hypothetical protein
MSKREIADLCERVEALEAAVATIGHNDGPPLDEPDDKPILIADSRVAARYDVSTRTLARWDEIPDLEFPPPVYIRDRRYREPAKLEKWDRANARKAAAQTKPRGVAGRTAKTAADAASTTHD